jgi:hypothetical protein
MSRNLEKSGELKVCPDRKEEHFFDIINKICRINIFVNSEKFLSKN